jgi:penicillin-binding protein 1A
VDLSRAWWGAEQVTRFWAAKNRPLRFPPHCLWWLPASLIRILLRTIWRILKRATVWFVTESPLAEPRRSAHRPLLRLIPWLVITAGWIAITLVSVASYYASILPDPR